MKFITTIKDGTVQEAAGEYVSYRAARDSALRTFGAILAEPSEGREWKSLLLELADETGLVLLNLEFFGTESSVTSNWKAID